MRKVLLLGAAMLCIGAGAIAVSSPKPKPIVADGGGPIPECIPGDPLCKPPNGGGNN